MKYLLILLATAGIASAQKRTCEAPKPATDPEFRVGQVWSYHTRPGDEGSTVSIYKIETQGKIGEVIHVRVDGLHIHNGRGDEVPAVPHMPFERKAFAESVVRLLRTDKDAPDAKEGYDNWRNACGGVYSIVIADVIRIVQKQLGGE